MTLKSLGLDDTEYLNDAINKLLRVVSEIEKLNRRIFIKGIRFKILPAKTKLPGPGGFPSILSKLQGSSKAYLIQTKRLKKEGSPLNLFNEMNITLIP